MYGRGGGGRHDDRTSTNGTRKAKQASSTLGAPSDMRKLWCAARELDWAGSAVRGRAGGERKVMQTG